MQNVVDEINKLLATETHRPTRAELAIEIANSNRRCGHVDNEAICLLKAEHEEVHVMEQLTKVIPF